MSKTNIKCFSYKGYVFPVVFCGEGWGEAANCFATGGTGAGSGPTFIDFTYKKTMEELEQAIKEATDRFVDDVPETVEELMDKFAENCMDWTGYEDCEFDTSLAEDLLRNFCLKHNIDLKDK